MNAWALAALLLLLAHGVTVAQDDNPERATPRPAVAADSTTAELPRKVYHRSSLEEFAALPGKVAYLPFDLLLTVSEFAIAALWEERLLDQFKGWLTTADGRLGVRPLASPSIGTGARLFYKDAYGVDAELTSSRGGSVSRRQHHFLVLDLPRLVLAPGRSRVTMRFRK